MSKSCTIRDATAGDVPAITAIYADAVLHGTASFELDPPNETEMVRRFHAITGDSYPYIVATDEADQLLGYAYASSHRPRPAYRWTVENSVYVDPKAFGRGIGKALLTETIDRCTRLGFRQMVAVIGGSDHTASIRLHERLGFKHAGVLPMTGFKHGQWLDSVFMQLPLGEAHQSDPDPATYPGTLYQPG